MSIYNVSIICPLYNEENYIVACMDSILQSDYPKEHLEVFFVDGLSADHTPALIARYCEKHSHFHLLTNPNKTAPYALNIGIKAAKGDVIMRIDAHSTYPTDYISTLVRYLFALDADNVGAVLNTVAAKDTLICHALALASAHPFGVGDARFRIGTTKIIETDTVPFGCYRKTIFERVGLFDEELTRNQDDEFNGRIRKQGGTVYLIPEVVINYMARDTVKKMAKMYYQYGLFKPLVNKKLKKVATVRQLFPVFFVLGLVAGCIGSFLWDAILWIYLLILVFYACIAFAISVREAYKRRKGGLMLVLPFVFFSIHIGYGVGYWTGIYKLLCKGSFAVSGNRN